MRLPYLGAERLLCGCSLLCFVDCCRGRRAERLPYGDRPATAPTDRCHVRFANDRT
jgi:hypothetical protein